MQSVLEELYHGKLENSNIMRDNEEYGRLAKEAEDIYKQLEDGTAERKTLLNNLWLAEAGQESEASCTFFKEGFKTCMQIMAEILKI